MIPASYMFKDAFQKAWYDPDIEAAVERHDRHIGPSRLAGLWSWLGTFGRPAMQDRPGRAPAAPIKA